MAFLRDITTFLIGASTGFYSGKMLASVLLDDDSPPVDQFSATVDQDKRVRAKIAKDSASAMTEAALTQRFRNLTGNPDALPAMDTDPF